MRGIKHFLFALLITACTTNVGDGTPINANANTATPRDEINTPYPGPIQPTLSGAEGVAYPASHEIPYYERQYQLVGSCGRGECLFVDDISQPAYPIGYATLRGYYVPVERDDIPHHGTENCDGFVLTSGPQELLTAYEAYFAGDAAVMSKTTEGNLVINISLWNEDEATKETIRASSPEHVIGLRVLNEPPPLFRGVVSCFSPIELLGVIDLIDVSELSDTYLITEADQGETFTYRITSRFTVDLDADKYPLAQLACEPEAIFGYISNCSIGGPGQYPICFEITRTGTCILKNGDFQVTIIGVPLR